MMRVLISKFRRNFLDCNALAQKFRRLLLTFFSEPCFWSYAPRFVKIQFQSAN